jgi:hypothetical protein
MEINNYFVRSAGGDRTGDVQAGGVHTGGKLDLSLTLNAVRTFWNPQPDNGEHGSN